MRSLVLGAILLGALSQNAFAQANPRISAIDPVADTVTIKNFGNASVDISSYWTCTLLVYSQFNSHPLVSGSLNLAPGAEVTISIFLDDTAADFNFYTVPDFPDPNDMVDFTQYGAGGLGREFVAVSKGIWGAGDFVAGTGPFTYTGDGSQNGVSFWAAAFPAIPIPVAPHWWVLMGGLAIVGVLAVRRHV